MGAYIIAEAGVNHNGNLALAKRLVDAAKESGADCVKFQTYKTESLISKFAEKAEYQKAATGSDESQLDMLRSLELPYGAFRELKHYCESVDIDFLSTPFDLGSVNFLAELGMKLWKIPSGELTNLPYLTKVARQRLPVIMSTGMSTLEEVTAAMKVLRDNESGSIALLHCTTEYPAPFGSVNLKAMLTLKDEFRVPVGYSDHTTGIAIPIAAVALGATFIEKHFTLDKKMSGPDHMASIEPRELKEMVESIRNVEAALGDGIKSPSLAELKNIPAARKSVVAARDIKKGETLTEGNLAVKRPGNGISPMRFHDVLGRKAKRDFSEDELIEL
ncbi:MAG: N-acetylneuraminate synthase [Clostridiales bacterium]|jgi:N,N'-diacetyllegionaminate synthase|nr:N-acetylneuraminate synthase [Clostridiales bacterium]